MLQEVGRFWIRGIKAESETVVAEDIDASVSATKAERIEAGSIVSVVKVFVNWGRQTRRSRMEKGP